MTRSPRSLPSLPAVAVAAAAALTAACGGSKSAPARPTPVEQGGPSKGGELATAEAVIEASLAAQGGRERMSKLQAIRMTGTVVIKEMGVKGGMSAVSAPPRNALLVIELAGLGKIRQGVSNDVAWEINPATGARVITGEERDHLLRDSTFNADLAWKQLYPKADLAGVVEYTGQQAYKVVLTSPDGDTRTRYFAKDTLLPLGIEKVTPSQMGKMPGEEQLSDWREVGGLKFPHKTVLKLGPQTLEILVDKVELDPPLDPSTFALPPEIAALQQK